MPEDTNQPPIDAFKIEIPEALEGLFCEPAFQEGEDPDLYRRLRDAVIADRKPVTVIDWIAVHDQVTKLWEERGLRRACAALIRGGTLKALEYFFTYINRDLSRIREASSPSGKPQQLALSYFSKDAKERAAARSLLAQFGITPAELHAKAAQDNSDAVQMFEHMIAARERGRRKLRREDERQRRRQDMQKSKARSGRIANGE